MATFVLVPGAWSGAWAYQWLAPHLREHDHRVHAVALSGVGERVDLAHPGITLDTHITDVVTALDFADLRNVILVGGSYGGMIITGVADQVPERLAQVVYLDAAVPDDGQSSYDIWPDGAEVQATDQQEAEAAGTPGFLPPPLAWIEDVVTNVDVRTTVLARLTPHPLATLTQPIRLTNPNAARVPRTYMHCTVTSEPDPPYLARIHADPEWHYVALPFDHLAVLTAPRETAEALRALV
jgi:pimeloyl-ACP methyl ester carboxylesterase